MAPVMEFHMAKLVWRQLRDMVRGIHRPKVGKWRRARTHTTHPDDLYEDDYLFRIHYLFKLVAFRLIIRIFNYSCEIHVYEKFPKQEN